MLERATGCLDTGVRHLRRTPPHLLRSRRSLHSAFWCHGAGDIDLPSWWISLLQLPTSEQAALSPGRTKKIPNSPSFQYPGIGFLDFLYPTKTLALIHKFVIQDKVGLRGRSQRPSVQNAVRAYTSVAAESFSDFGKGYNESYYPPTSPTVTTQHRADNMFIPPVSTATEYYSAWRKYRTRHRSFRNNSSDELSTLLQRIKATGNRLVVERASHILELIDKTPISERQSMHYEYGIQAALHLDKLDRALALHGEAISRVEGPIGTSALLHYLVEHNIWFVAVDSWYAFCKARKLYSEQCDIWNGVDSMDPKSLMSRATTVIRLAIRKLKTEQGDRSAKIREFALRLVLCAFNKRGTEVSIQKHQALWETLLALTDPTAEHFHAALEQLLSVKRRGGLKTAISMYDSTAENYQDFIPSRETLEDLVIKTQDGHSPHIIKVFDDFRRYHVAPTRRAYRWMITEMSYQGDATAVYSLIREYEGHYGTPKDSEDHPKESQIYEDLLLLHLRRAEVREVVRVFREFPSTFGFTPTIGCWNIVIASHVKVGDNKGALNWYNRLLESDLKPTARTFSTLTWMYGRRGDTEAIEELLEACKERGIKTTYSMIDSMVLAHISNNELEEAEKLVKKAMTMKLDGDRTRMWNILLNAFAVHCDLDKVYQLYQSMREADVWVDASTFAALMMGLCVKGLHLAAYRVLKVVMPVNNVQATSTHYAIVMNGFIRNRQYHKALTVYHQMLMQDVRSDLNTQTLLIKVNSLIDVLKNREDRKDGTSATLVEAEGILDQITETMDSGRVDRFNHDGFSRLDDLKTSYFDFIIYSYGYQGAFDKVAQLYDKYIALKRKLNTDVDEIPPFKLLCALMMAYLRKGEHDEVERCWYLVLEKTEPLTCQPNSDLLEPNWVLTSCRTALHLPLLYYMSSLSAHGRVDDMQAVIDHLQFCGYSISNKVWNLYVQSLATQGQGLKAFEVCERELISGWPAWGWGNSRSYGIRTVQYLERRQPKPHETEKRVPNIKTFRQLAAVYNDLQSQYAFAGPVNKKLRELKKAAPRSFQAVIDMPRVDDDY